METNDIDNMLIDLLPEYFLENRDLFPLDIDSIDKFREAYQCFRTFRRSSDSKALKVGVDETDVDILNRWKIVKAAKGSRPSHPMRQHYAQFDLLLGPFLRYTFTM